MTGSSLKSNQAVIRGSELVLFALGGVGPVASETLGAGLELVPGLRSHRTIGGFEDLELTVSSDLADAHGLGQVVVGHHLHRTLRRVELDADQGLTHLVVVEAVGLLDSLLPQVNHVVGRLLRVSDLAVGAVLGLEVCGELLGCRGVDRHHVVPSAVMALKELRADGADLLFRDGIAHHVVAVIGGDAGVLDLLEEGDVLVTIQGVDDHTAVRQGLLDLGDDRSNLGVAQGQVVLTDHFATQRGELLLGDGVGGAGEDVIRTHQEEGLAGSRRLLIHEFGRRLRLLVRGGTGVEDVVGTLLTLVLNRVVEESVLGFVNRQHRLTAGGGPSTENDRHLVLIDQLLGLLSEGGPVRGAVLDDVLNLVLLAIDFDATSGIDLIDGHLLGVHQRGFRDRHGSRQGMQDADLDGVVKFSSGSAVS